MLKKLRKTSRARLAAGLRFLVGLTFVMAGILKVTVQHLGEAFEGQLMAADIPLKELSFLLVPIFEMLIGLTLLLGWHTRISALLGIAITLVATYVHLVVEDPSLFPLQTIQPIGPLMLLAALLYILWKGGGAWSMDLATTRRSSYSF